LYNILQSIRSITIRFPSLRSRRDVRYFKVTTRKCILYAAVFRYLVGVNRLFGTDSSESEILYNVFSTT
jgi:hypothetical protein